MKIKTITIHNFRSIIDATINLRDYSLLVGVNNSGKSNVIDALLVFYEKDLKYVPERDFPKLERVDDEVWIEIEYNLEPSEAEDLKKEYVLPKNRLKVRKFFRTEKDRKLGIYAYEGEELSDSLFYGARSVQQGKLGGVIYIPAVSRIDDETKLTGPSPLRDILTDIFENLVATSKAFEDFTREFDEFKQDLKQEETEDKKSLTGLEAEINEEIKEWGLEFDLDINPVDHTNIIRNLIDFRIIDKQLGEKVQVYQEGHGFQRHLIYTLINISTKYQTKEITKKKKDFTPNMKLILFEEPEAFLHPAQQDLLNISLHQIINNPGNQALLASHSPQFVSCNSFDIPSIIHLCRDEKARTLIGQISEEDLQLIFEENQKINDILKNTKFAAEEEDLTEDMEAIKYFMWLNPERCGMFFAKHVLLVEGPTEKVLLNYLIDTGKLVLPQGGLFVLDCFGKFNFHRFMNILEGLNIRHSLLMDADENKEYHEAIKELILESSNQFTNEIIEFPNRIEDFLEVDLSNLKSKHRKPQHLLFKVRQGEISEKKIEELVYLVNEML